MKLLIFLIVIIGLLYDVEAKSFQKIEKNDKDHVYEHLYLEKIPDKHGGYEMRYVPHVDGKPIFIPLDELEEFTTPSMVKARPSKLRHKPGINTPPIPSKKLYGSPVSQKFPNLNIPNANEGLKTSTNPSLIKKKATQLSEREKNHINNPISSNEYLKLQKEMGNSKLVNQKHYDHPVVIDVVTTADNLNYDEKIDFGTIKKKADVKNAIKMKDMETSLKQETGEKSVIKDNFSKYKLNENILKSNNHASDLKERPFDHKDYDSPIVVESLTKEIYEDYPVVIRPQAESTVDKIEVININKKPVGNNLKTEKSKSTLKTGTPKETVTKSDYELAMLKHTKFTRDHINSFPGVSSEQDEEFIQFSKIKPPKHQTLIRSESPAPSKDLSITENTITESLFSQGSVYHYGRDSNHDSPVIVEALVKKTDERTFDTLVKKTDDYDSPVVIEALVKKTDEKSYDTLATKTDDYDSPVVIEALVKKTGERNYDTLVTKTDDYDSPVVFEAIVKKTDQTEDYALPIVSSTVVKNYPDKDSDQTERPSKEEKHPIKKENGEKMSDKPLAVVKTKNVPAKVNKKMVKYSTKMKHPKNSIHSHYDDSSKRKDTSENKQSSLNAPNIIETFENPVKQSDVFSNEDLFEELDVDQLDVGSGIINDVSSSSKSNIWPLLTSFHSQERNKLKKCTTPSKEPGNCMPIQMCPNPNLRLTLDDLIKRICALDDVFIGICCPEFPAETIKVNWENLKNGSSNDQEVLRKPGECGKIQESEDPQSWPWMAPLISVSTRRIFCGGVLITPQHVLTAAHCTTKIPRNQIVVLLSTNQELEVVEIKRHTQYNPRTMHFDIALLKLSRKVSSPFICLSDENTFVGMEALMLGWQGSFAASKVEEKLSVISPQECRKGGVVVGDNIMCTQPRTEDVVMCNVDSGAPLIVKHNERYEVIGLLTWNRNCDSTFPAVFTRVSYFKGWIKNHST